MIRCDIANYKPVSREPESISEATPFLKTCHMLAVTLPYYILTNRN